MDINTDLIVWIMSQILVAGVIWGGIRMDIKNIHERINATCLSTQEAHRRVDEILLKG